MTTNRWVIVGAASAAGALLSGCGSGDDSSVPVPVAAGADASVRADAGDAGTPARLLLSYNGATQSELVAFDLTSKAVDGVYVYPGFIGTTVVTPAAPWLLEQATDVVARLDPQKPWQVQSSWSVALTDYASDAGFSTPYSDPDAVVVGAGASKAYVLRYTRNLIAVIDATQVADGGAPTKTIDLSSQLQAAGDGYVEMTAGYYDSTTQRLYVLLANIDRFNVGADGFTLLCGPTTPTLVAVDTTTDTLVDLNPGSDAGATGWSLPGFNPAFGVAPMVYDPPNRRLLVLESGCNTPAADGGAGPVAQREIDSISLSTGVAQKLVDLDSAAFPSGLFYADPHHVVVQLDTAYAWDPASSTLGPAIANAPQAFSLDGQGNLVGVTQAPTADGGLAPWTVVSVNPGDGGVTTLGTSPFPAADAGGVGPGFVAAAQLWLAP